MAYRTLENQTLDLRTLLQFPSLDTPIFWPLILFTTFITITLLSFFREVSREGRGNFMSSLAVGGYVTTALGVAMTLLGLVQYQVVVLILVISLVFQVIFLITNKD